MTLVFHGIYLGRKIIQCKDTAYVANCHAPIASSHSEFAKVVTYIGYLELDGNAFLKTRLLIIFWESYSAEQVSLSLFIFWLALIQGHPKVWFLFQPHIDSLSSNP